MSKVKNKGKGNIESRDDWQTPKSLFDQLDQQYKFTFDCCASKENSKCLLYSDDFIREVVKVDHAWINPPFSKAKKMLDHFFKVVIRGVAIYRCDNMETKVWQQMLKKADWVFIPNKRIQYEGKKGSGAVFPSALIGYNVDPPITLEGSLLMVVKANGKEQTN